MQQYYVLEVRYPDGTAESHQISEEVRILGRSKIKADLQISDKKASGRHAELRFAGGAVTVTDLDSTNGTHFQGRRVTGAFALPPGASFKVGDAAIRLMAVHGFQEDQAKTVVARPSWMDEEASEDEATRALDAAQYAALTNKAGGEEATMRVPPPQPARAQPARAQPARAQPARAQPARVERPVDPYQATARQPGQPQQEPYGRAPGGYQQEDPRDQRQGGAGYYDQPDPYAQQRGGGYYDQPDPYAQQQDPYAQQQDPYGQQQDGYYDDAADGAYDQQQGGWDEPMAEPVDAAPEWARKAAEMPPTDGRQAPPQRRPQPTAMAGGDISFAYTGTGGELFVKRLIGGLLSSITLGIYLPFFLVDFQKWLYARTQVAGGPHGRMRLEFHGKVGKLFLLGLSMMLVPLSLFIATPWIWCAFKRYWIENTRVVADDGAQYGLEFRLAGGKLLGFALLQGLFCAITLYIYTPWAMCKWKRLFLSNIVVTRNGTPEGNFDFAGTGGSLFVLSLWNGLLLLPTLYIWMPWCLVNMWRFMNRNTTLRLRNRQWTGDFTGKGGSVFVHGLKAILIPLTGMIYMSWWQTGWWKFERGSTVLREHRG